MRAIVADEQRDPDLETSPAAEPAESAEPGADVAEATADSQPDRRAFLRQMSGDAVRTAGRLAGFSSIVRRSVVAAGDAAIRDFETPSVPTPPTVSTPEPAVDAVIAETPASPPVAEPAVTLTAEQQAFLAMGAQAVLAVNDPAGAPQLTSSLYHWDGETFRLPGRVESARVMNIDRDARVSLLVGDASSEAWVAVTGTASLAAVNQVHPGMMMILGKYHGDDQAADRWDDMRSSGDLTVIQVRPLRFLWRPA